MVVGSKLSTCYHHYCSDCGEERKQLNHLCVAQNHYPPRKWMLTVGGDQEIHQLDDSLKLVSMKPLRMVLFLM